MAKVLLVDDDLTMLWSSLDKVRGEVSSAKLRKVLAVFFDDDLARICECLGAAMPAQGAPPTGSGLAGGGGSTSSEGSGTGEEGAGEVPLAKEGSHPS